MQIADSNIKSCRTVYIKNQKAWYETLKLIFPHAKTKYCEWTGKTVP